MSALFRSQTLIAACILAAGLVTPIDLSRAYAEDISSEQIIKALTPTTRVTRGLSMQPEARLTLEDRRFIDGLRKRKTRSLTLDDRDKISKITEKKPSIDLEINFDFNSAAIRPEAMSQITALGHALASPALKGGTFILAGHTDAKGGDAYNKSLSDLRADAVRRLLSDQYKIDASRLLAVGYGKADLKNPADPFGAENRRVQIINIRD